MGGGPFPSSVGIFTTLLGFDSPPPGFFWGLEGRRGRDTLIRSALGCPALIFMPYAGPPSHKLRWLACTGREALGFRVLVP